MKNLLKNILPHGIVRMVQKRQERGYQRSRAVLQQQAVRTKEFTHADLLEYLESRGLDRDQIRQGSIPEPSLAFLASILKEKHAGKELIRGLHVGNFLGVSLAYLTDAARQVHLASVVVAVDPNLEHRGIAHPQDHVCALLNHLGLSENVLLCCGFSHAKNVGNDGRNYLENYRFLETEEIARKVSQEHAPHGVFGNLQKLLTSPFDFALIDGNHESVYVEEELRKIHPLMKRGGYIFMDDISEGWPMLKQVFEASSSTLFRIAEADGRVGVLEVR